MSRSIQNALAIFLLISLNSQAGEISCESAAALRKRARTCEENLVYAQAARQCLERYDAAVAAAQGKMAEQLSVFVGSDRQAQSLENAKSGYKMSKDRLQALARLGYQLEKEVFAYKNEIVFPDDFGSAGAAGLRAEIFLEGQHCYQDTQKLVASFAELLGLHAKELELTAKISEGFAQKAFRGEQNLRPEDLLVLQKANSSPAKGSGKNSPSKGESKKNDSDITGTDKKKK